MPIHPTAIVDSAAEVHPSADIGPYAIVDGPVRIGAEAKVFPHAYVCGWTTLREHSEIHMGAVVGHVPQDRAFTGERSYCEIGPHTVIREYATVHRGTMPESKTVIGPHCLLGATAHVAHNCHVDDHVTIMNGVLLAGHVHVGPRAFISGNAGIHQFVRVGELAMISGQAQVSTDVPPFMMVYQRNQLAGINRVGMRRAELSSEEIDEIRRAYRLLYRSGKTLPHSITQLDETLTTPAGRRLVSFLQAPRKRPLLRAGRGAAETKPAVE